MNTVMNCIWVSCVLVAVTVCQASDIDIFAAAEQGDLEAVKKLVQEDPGLVATSDERGYSPLHKAVYNNRLSTAEYLLAQGADINALSISGSTPLHGAASYGHIELVRLLLDRGASPDITNAGGYTPLLGASFSGHGEIVRLLAEREAGVNTSLGGMRTPLGMAVWNDDAELTKFLLSRGANANIVSDMGVSLPFFALAFRSPDVGTALFDRITDFAEKDSTGATILHYVAASDFEDLVERLLDKGIAPDVKDSFDKTPLSYALAWGNYGVASILKAHGAVSTETGAAWFRGSYLGRSAAGKTPVEFAGAEMRTPFAPHGGMAISPDGKEMLWCDHAPARGMWYIRQVNGVWQQPVIAPFIDLTIDHAPGHPSFTTDGNRIYYHSRRELRPGEPSGTRSDIWFVERTGNGWSKPESIGSPVNTEENESGPTTVPSGNMYFVGEGYKDGFGAGDIYVSEFINGKYSEPRNLGLAINSEYFEMPAAVSSDESYMIFASNRPNLGNNSLQLYVSFKDNGEWSNAVSLGRTINRGDSWDPIIVDGDRLIVFHQNEKYHSFSADLIEDIRQATIGSAEVIAPVRIPVFRKGEQLFEHAATNKIALGDLDGDKDLDAVFSNMGFNDSRVYLNNGHGEFTATEQLLTQQGHGIDLGDLDGDGDLDIFMTCAGYGAGGVEYSRPSRVYFNDGKAHFTMTTQDLGDSLLSGNAIHLSDIDTDGDLDAMIVYYQERNRIYLNDGHGEFTLSDLTFTTGSNRADLDGDGDVDNLLREEGVGFRILLNDGAGNFTEVSTHPDTILSWGGVGLGDFDGDGDLDAVVAYNDFSEHRFSTVWYNDGTGRFVESDVRLPLTRYASLAVGDLNGDSHIDVFVHNVGLPGAIWINDGKGRLIDSGIRIPGRGLTGCALGDLDGDGDLDAFLAAFLSGPNEVWFNE